MVAGKGFTMTLIDAELAKCLERAKVLRELREIAKRDAGHFRMLFSADMAALSNFYKAADNLALPIADDVQKLVRAVEEMREAVKSRCYCHVYYKGSKCDSCDTLASVAEILEGK